RQSRPGPSQPERAPSYRASPLAARSPPRDAGSFQDRCAVPTPTPALPHKGGRGSIGLPPSLVGEGRGGGSGPAQPDRRMGLNPAEARLPPGAGPSYDRCSNLRCDRDGASTFPRVLDGRRRRDTDPARGGADLARQPPLEAASGGYPAGPGP